MQQTNKRKQPNATIITCQSKLMVLWLQYFRFDKRRLLKWVSLTLLLGQLHPDPIHLIHFPVVFVPFLITIWKNISWAFFQHSFTVVKSMLKWGISIFLHVHNIGPYIQVNIVRIWQLSNQYCQLKLNLSFEWRLISNNVKQRLAMENNENTGQQWGQTNVSQSFGS